MEHCFTNLWFYGRTMVNGENYETMGKKYGTIVNFS